MEMRRNRRTGKNCNVPEKESQKDSVAAFARVSHILEFGFVKIDISFFSKHGSEKK